MVVAFTKKTAWSNCQLLLRSVQEPTEQVKQRPRLDVAFLLSFLFSFENFGRFQ